MTDTTENTREKILRAAEAEFLARGFRDASLRSIARQAGVTTGSLYWHFKNKDDLFAAIVGPHYDHILGMFRAATEEFFTMPPEDQRIHMGDVGGACMSEIAEYFYQHKPAFRILLTGAAGSRYEHFLHELTEEEIASTRAFAEQMQKLGHPRQEVPPELEHVITSSMFAGMAELVIHDMPLETARVCMDRLHAFYTAGWRHLLQVPADPESRV